MDSKPYVVPFIGMIYILIQAENKLSTQRGKKNSESFSFPLVWVIDECFLDNVTAFLYVFCNYFCNGILFNCL